MTTPSGAVPDPDGGGGADDLPGPDVLFIVRARDSYPDVADGLRRMVADGTLRGGAVEEIPADGATSDDARYWAAVQQHVAERRTEIVVLHHFHSPALPDPRAHIRRVKGLPHRPVVALTNGDPFFNGFFRPSYPSSFLQTASVADAVFSSSMGSAADHIVARSNARMALLPHGLCQDRFGAPPPPRSTREFRVVFIGSNNRARNPLHTYFWYARQREKLVRRLGARFGRGFALFGRGWDGLENWLGPVPFADQQRTCQRADIVVGGVPFSPARYYQSDRPFIQIASGVPFVDLAVEGVETILRDGEHWHLAGSVDDVVDVCDDVLSRPTGERNELAAAAADFVRDKHTVEARCRYLVRTMEGTRRAIIAGVPPPDPIADFFLPEVDRGSELQLATRNWRASTEQVESGIGAR